MSSLPVAALSLPELSELYLCHAREAIMLRGTPVPETATVSTASLPCDPPMKLTMILERDEDEFIRRCILGATPAHDGEPASVRQIVKASGYSLTRKFRAVMDAMIEDGSLIRNSRGIRRAHETAVTGV